MKKKYLNDFIMSADGSYVYNGKHYEWTAPLPRKNHLIKLWLNSCVAALLIITCGVLPSGGMNNSFYIIIPYVIEFCSVVATLAALYKITISGTSLREYVYNSSAKKLPLRSYMICINAALLILGELVYVISHKLGTIFSVDTAVILLQLVIVALTYFIHRQNDEIKWSER